MKIIIKKISKVIQIILLAPIKLPGKALNIIRYVALGLGIVDQVLEDEKKEDYDSENNEGKKENMEENHHGEPE